MSDIPMSDVSFSLTFIPTLDPDTTELYEDLDSLTAEEYQQVMPNLSIEKH